MSAELRALRDDPFEQLLLLETRLRVAKLDITAGQAQSWVGLGFRIGQAWLVAPKDDVREVIVPPKPTRVPNGRPWLHGVANVRGELLTIIDLPHFLGLQATAETRASRLLVFNSTRVPAGFLVDEVAGYRQFTPTEQRNAHPLSAYGTIGAALRGQGASAPFELGQKLEGPVAQRLE